MNEELSDEGKKLWDMLSNDDFAKNLKVKKKKERSPKLLENYNIRIALKKLQQNSKTVVREAEEEIQKLTKEEKYYAAYGFKVAHLVHSNLIERIQRILENKEPFDFEINLDDDNDDPPESISEVFIR